MKQRSRFLLALLSCYCFSLFNASLAYSADAEQNYPRHKQQSSANTLYGKVTDTIDSAGYTYVEIDTGDKKIWAAGPVTAVNTGDMIAIPTKMPMKNFHSQSLQRDFPIIYFADRFITDNQTASLSSQSSTTSISQPAAKAIKAFDKVKDGRTIAEIYTNRNKIAGTTIRVRGQVTRYTPNILGKNWLHIRDNSTTNDLTITTDDKVSIGDIVVAEGKLELDRDFGYGYVYALIIENARIE